MKGGNLEVEVQATDSVGAAVSASFQVQVVPLPRMAIAGTTGNDRFQINRLNGSADSWRVVRNGQTLFSGNLNNIVVSIDGLGGNDRVTFGGSNSGNTFELNDQYSKFDQVVVVQNNIEQLVIDGGQGNDQLDLYSMMPLGPASITFNGNNGDDAIQSILVGNGVPTQWNVTGPNRGDIDGWLEFQRVERLLGKRLRR